MIDSSSSQAPGCCSTPMDFLTCLCLLQLLYLASSGVAAQAATLPARALDAMLQDYAYRAFVRPHTGIVYNASVPPNLTGVAVSAVRLRSGSLRRKGFSHFLEFAVPTGIVVEPCVERVVLVYHNLGNWSHYYYPLPGYTYLSPVLGLLVYDAANLSAVGLQELSLVASGSPISISFSNLRSVQPGAPAPRCVWFDLDGVPQFRNLEASNVCSTFRRGHSAIVVNSSEIAPGPLPPGTITPPIPTQGVHSKGSSKGWKIAVGVVGGVIALVLSASLVVCLARYKRDRKLEVMERNAEAGETLRMSQVGRSQAPVALGTRTQPVIESEYVA
uniref:Legume lectin domain-containing protein n=1 Tax=Oryza brachyantha TaxID=4533 RepID=J3NAV7_ORYBR